MVVEPAEMTVELTLWMFLMYNLQHEIICQALAELIQPNLCVIFLAKFVYMIDGDVRPARQTNITSKSCRA